MKTTHSPDSSISSSRAVSKLALWLLALIAVASPLRADVCVWRDPERTMQRLFPAATDYKTVTTKMTPERIAAIEQRLGVPLEASEKKEFDIYDITGSASGKASALGTVMALAGKGEYGTIEVVIGVDPAGRVVGAYIQRSRERVTAALQSPDFLGQFTGKTRSDRLEIGASLKPASPAAEAASRTVAFVIRKMLILHEVLRK